MKEKTTYHYKLTSSACALQSKKKINTNNKAFTVKLIDKTTKQTIIISKPDLTGLESKERKKKYVNPDCFFLYT